MRLSCVLLLLLASAAPAATWKAGVAVRVITPSEPMWMAGYAGRKGPATDKEHDLTVKALALQDPSGAKSVLVTSDLVGVPRALTEAVAAEVKKKTGLPRERLMITVSHTHCGPVIEDNLSDMYAMPEAEAKKIAPYTRKVQAWMVEAVVAALGKLEDASLDVGMGTARFAVNRRKPTPKGVVNDANPDGPVDHDVPVLRVRSSSNKVVAIVFGYACHNTTMQFTRWCGDYAGFAMLDLEAKHKGAVAMFWSGCGGDSNPLPRSKIELCKKYGKELAGAVNDALAAKRTPVKGNLSARYRLVAIPFGPLPTKEAITADLKSPAHAVRKRAERLIKTLDDKGKLDDHYRHYPIQVWLLGDQVTWIALGGEVVVDYSLRLKKELPKGRAIWVTAYANDVMAYIPSKRVLREGGYEGDSSQVYYGQPTKWAPGIEEVIVEGIEATLKEAMGK
jgi:Neutral/alkaline non-lysosomal ceramidase, N-terminal